LAGLNNREAENVPISSAILLAAVKNESTKCFGEKKTAWRIPQARPALGAAALSKTVTTGHLCLQCSGATTLSSCYDIALDVDPISSAKHRILLGHQDNLLLKLLSTLLSPQFEIVASVHTGEETLEAVRSLQPDFLVLDIVMPDVSGIQIALRLQESGSATKIVFLASLEHTKLLEAALNSGARGFVFKGDIFRDLPFAISEALAGRIFVSSAHL
jgi:CheY-like chemotaxis protein